MSDKIFFFIDFPFVWIRKLTVPPCEVDHYDHLYTLLWPWFGIPTVMMIVKLSWPNSLNWLYYTIVAAAWTGFWYVIHRGKDRHEIPRFYIVIEVIGMCCGFVWTYYVSGALIDLLSMVGILTKLSATFLALTIIAVGNALPDALLTISLAK